MRELGAKSLLISEHVKRPVGADGYRLDNFGIDSEHDYDPFWAKCVELGVAPVVHSSLQSHRVTRSISSYVYNHIDGLSAAHESLCKSLFLGGVTRRFPELRIGFLEGGVAWACELFAGLVGHWEKRNRAEIWQLDPDRLDVDALMEYFERYGDDDVARVASTTSAPTSRARRPSPRTSTSSPRARSTGPTTCARCSSRASTSGARPTTRSWRGPSATTSTRSARGCARSSAPTSRTGTSPT